MSFQLQFASAKQKKGKLSVFKLSCTRLLHSPEAAHVFEFQLNLKQVLVSGWFQLQKSQVAWLDSRSTCQNTLTDGGTTVMAGLTGAFIQSLFFDKL